MGEGRVRLRRRPSTKPQTLGYALNDSPAGLAAWILEKWRSWSDSGGDLDQRFDRDFLLTLVTLYWVTASMPTSIRDYADNRTWPGDPLGPDDFVSTPTGVAVFEHHYVPEGNVPREAERTHVRRWTVMPSGGHSPQPRSPTCWPGTSPRSSPSWGSATRQSLHRGRARFLADLEAMRALNRIRRLPGSLQVALDLSGWSGASLVRVLAVLLLGAALPQQIQHWSSASSSASSR